jgi:small subunit ribosomal protein S3
MIERKFITQKINEHKIKEFLKERLSRMGYSRSELQKTPLGMKVIIWTYRPGLTVGRGGENIQEITEMLKTKFGLKSPQIDVREVEVPEMDPEIMAERISSQLSRFGVTRFKAIGYRSLTAIMRTGALGAEVKISGKVPGKRARYWRFNAGYLPKSGETSKVDVLVGYRSAKLKSGTVGITVKILPAGVRMPDEIRITKEVKVEEGGEGVGDTEKG